MAKQDFFINGTFVDKLAAMLERPLVQADCVVAPTSSPNTSPLSKRDVVLSITIPKTGGGTEVKEVRYYQLDLAGIGQLNLTKRSVSEDTTIYALISSIRRITGIPFVESDLVDAPVVVTGAVTEFTLPLVAKVGSKWFKGRYDLPVLRKPTLLSLATNGTYLGSI